MKKILAIAFVIILLFVSYSISAEFWGNNKSHIYHYPNCEGAKRISQWQLVRFGSPEEAVKAGYTPCKACKPPTSSKSTLDSDRKMDFAKSHAMEH